MYKGLVINSLELFSELVDLKRTLLIGCFLNQPLVLYFISGFSGFKNILI